MNVEVQFMRAAKALVALDNIMTVPISHAGNLCPIYANSEGSGEFSYLRRLARIIDENP